MCVFKAVFSGCLTLVSGEHACACLVCLILMDVREEGIFTLEEYFKKSYGVFFVQFVGETNIS